MSEQRPPSGSQAHGEHGSRRAATAQQAALALMANHSRAASRAVSLDKARARSNPRMAITPADADLLTERLQQWVNSKNRMAKEKEKKKKDRPPAPTATPSASAQSLLSAGRYDMLQSDVDVEDRLFPPAVTPAHTATQAQRRKRRDSAEEEDEERKRQRATTSPEHGKGPARPPPQAVATAPAHSPAAGSYAAVTRAPVPSTSTAPAVASCAASELPLPTPAPQLPAAAEIKKPRYPPLVVEVFPNWASHFRELKGRLGHAPNARPFGNGVRFTPESAEEYRLIQSYLVGLEKTVKLVWFSYALPEERSLKVAIRGLPADTNTDEIIEDLRAQGFEPEAVRNIRASKGRPGCIFFALLKRTPNITPAIYEVGELLCMPGVKIEAWKGKKGPAQCHRCQAFRHSSHNCHRPLACVRCGGSHYAGDCPVPRDSPPTCANCQGAHPANNRSCPAFKSEARNKKAGTIARTEGQWERGQTGLNNTAPASATAPPATASIDTQPRVQANNIVVQPGQPLMAPANDPTPRTGKLPSQKKLRKNKKKFKTGSEMGKPEPINTVPAYTPVPPRTTPAGAQPTPAPQKKMSTAPSQERPAGPTQAWATAGPQRPAQTQPELIELHHHHHQQQPLPQRPQRPHPHQQQPQDAGRLAILETAIQIMQEVLQALRAGEDPVPVVIAGMGKLLQAY